MTRQIIILFFFFVTHLVFSQSKSKSDSYTITFNYTPIKEAILKLEKETTFTFYFEEDWFDEKTITGAFTNESLENILDAIFQETPLNYLIYGNKVILSNNSVVFTTLPKGYFGEKNDSIINNPNPSAIDESAESKTAVFHKQYDNTKSSNNSKLITIGKQNSNSTNSYYNVRGKVKNATTNEPLQNLVISVVGKKINAVTDENGDYSISLPAGYNSIETILMGFKSSIKNVIVYGDGSLNFSIAEGAEQLNEVVIQADQNKNVRSAVVGITSLDVTTIKTIPLVLGERDILRVATTLPGITTAGEGSAGFNVRGGKTDQNLILLDDAVLYNPSHFFGFFTALNPFTTGSLDIYKASIPAQYGGRLSSVFDIKTKDGNMDKFSGEGSIGSVTANIAVEAPIVKGKASIMTGFRATYSDWILKKLDEESLKNSEASFLDGIVKYKHNIDPNNSVQATLYYSHDKFSISSDSLFKYSNTIGSLKWDHTFNEKNRGSLTLVNSQYKNEVEYDADANLNFDFGYKINETQVKLNMKYLFSKKHKFDYGISSKLYHVDPGSIQPIGPNSDVEPLSLQKEKGLESAIFISDLFEINDRLLLDVGIRFSFYMAMGPATQLVYQEGVPKDESSITEVNQYGNNEVITTYGGPEARVSFRYFLTPELSIKGGYSSTIQYIHLLSNNTTESPTDTWKLSDLNIKPERAQQIAFGLFRNFDNNNLEVSVEGYYKKMENILDYKIGADLILNENLERDLLEGEGKAYGVEFLINKKAGKFNGWLSYTYSRSFVKLESDIEEEQVNNGEFFPANYDKPHDFTAIMNYKLTHRFSFSANFTYQTGRPITYPIGKFNFANEEQVVYSDRNEYRIPDYYRLDLGVNIEGNHKIKKLAHSFWNISVYNVLGRDNPYSIIFENEDGNIQAYKTSIFAMPIPTITYNFKF
ncbi:carboxypeptidase-like regulatory domain-containing protein [Bizionia arctica]|uniref:TonB-dependent receptor n=1 Tax=Bizionia arctica TaxID=1495645 RepID=A0A917LNE2_9FLAO|nr:carboxypeptidase-like regulatory domain-containing protein [Bizionia arctica]GGG45765.1 TonB-dependent receptor [Bizionia arctica]